MILSPETVIGNPRPSDVEKSDTSFYAAGIPFKRSGIYQQVEHIISQPSEALQGEIKSSILLTMIELDTEIWDALSHRF